uniref:Variant-specific surface protein S7 n=1 Tax=Giardia intestinalis TaxID=5741 RepID=Q8I8W2_GIAIN|nr:variant-specific surface protein S7 [Giardia intestinalis]
MGVAGCSECSHTGTSGPATCTECQAGFVTKDSACVKCGDGCSACSADTPTQCTACVEGKFLKDGNTCVEATECGADKYADKKTWTCKACDPDIAGCTACEYNDATGKPRCTNCGTNKTPRTTLDGTSTCVTKDYAGCQGADNGLFMTEDNVCRLCSDPAASDSEPKNKGIAGCKTCTKQQSQKPECIECLEGYIKEGNGPAATCEACGANCATCSEKADKTKCQTCKTGFFLKVSSTPGECFACDDTNNGGIEGCSQCTMEASTFKCTDCKVNYRKQSGTSPVTCTKVCEDDTACGGTSGACDAMIIDDQGTTKHYCSYCGDSSKYPIDGLCASEAQSNTCNNHVCESCTTGYFLYMGGCYSTQSPPGQHMCKTAANGVCTAVNENNKYFLVPGASNAQQSVLACSNPLGTLVDPQGTAKAYVGVHGCSQCTAPAALTTVGMAAAVCTACDSGKVPNKDGSGCVTCSVGDCKSCVVDDVCEECNSGFSLDSSGASCVSSGANRSGLSTGAIAGISVAVVAVVGGLVGFLCWWFVCRGKA